MRTSGGMNRIGAERLFIKAMSWAAVLSVLALPLLGGSARAEEIKWRTREDRVRCMTACADKHSLPKISATALAELIKAYPGLKNMTPDRVRVVSYGSREFASWAKEIGRNPEVAGFGCTPHNGGPHPHFVAYYKGWPFVATFDAIMHGMGKYQDGTETRAEGIDKTHGSNRLEAQRVFGLFLAPTQHVVAQAEDAMEEKIRCAQNGPNCAIFASGNFKKLLQRGKGDPNNPSPAGIQEGGYPVAAITAMLGVEPDILVHAVPADTVREWQAEGKLDGNLRPTEKYRLDFYK